MPCILPNIRSLVGRFAHDGRSRSNSVDMSTIPELGSSHPKLGSLGEFLPQRFVFLFLMLEGMGNPYVMTGTRLNLDRYVPGLLTFVSNKLSRGASAVYRNLFGIGITEWRILSLLALEPGIPAQRICHVIGFDKALVSRTIKTLQKDRYVVVRSDVSDSRRQTITLTPAGLELHDRVIKVSLEREKLLLLDFSEKEIDILLKLLHRMHSRVDTVNSYRPKGQKPKKPQRKKPRLADAAE